MISSTKPSSIGSQSDSNSRSSSSVIPTHPWVDQMDRRLWRAIDFLHISIMICSIFTSIVLGSLRNDLYEQCPLYAQLFVRENVTQLLPDSFTRQTIWGSLYTCEWVSFAYLSAFALSFISLWIHVVFRRVLRTERLLRLPIGVTTLIFAVIALAATITVTDGVVRLCTKSETNLCVASGTVALSRSRWKIISLPIGGWFTALTLALNALARGIQLFSKPKKPPEVLKAFLNQMMVHRQRQRLDKDSSIEGSQGSNLNVDRFDTKVSIQPIPIQRSLSPQGLTNNPSASYYPSIPPVPQYRRIKKPSRFRRICCPCLRRRPAKNLYQPFVVPEPYFPPGFQPPPLTNSNPSDHLLCSRHSLPVHPSMTQTERSAPMDAISERLSPDPSSEVSFPGRRRSSVRFEDESPEPAAASPSTPPVTSTEQKETETTSTPSKNLERSVSFRNNEDDLWTTVTINAEASTFSHFNRLAVENLPSTTTTSVAANVSTPDNGITAIRVNSQSTIDNPIEISISSIDLSAPPAAPPPPPAPSSLPSTSMTSNRQQKNLFPARSLTSSSEDDVDLRHIKPLEEIQSIVTDKYNYSEISQALKSNVQRLRKTFLSTSEPTSHYDRPRNLRLQPIRTDNHHHHHCHASDC